MLTTFLNFPTEKIVNKLLKYSLLISLPLTFPDTVLAQPTSTPTPKNAETVSSSDAEVIKKLSGRWESQDATSSITVSFIFDGNGKLFLMMGDAQRSAAYAVTYQINSTPQPMHLNINLPDTPQPVLTIFDFTADGQMRMQIEGTNPGEPRPKEFSKNVTFFKKVSENTSLPQNVELVTNDQKPSENIAGNITESSGEGKQYIGSMNRGQQAYYLENNKFAKNIRDLGVGIKSETVNYRYGIILNRRISNMVVHTATPKKPNFKSYIGVVFIRKVKGEIFTDTAICESLKPGTKPPAIPRISAKSSQDVKCPSGSILLK
ncbi:type IV pilin-like G/H family protein [Anabaena sp. FACHB-1237]|uniref:type IV pilin-like G/H family protein n=1 Tax=Anabaena sp. FACHB-1237 TaxID=2692769 RepID=UPI0016810DC5|nr:type IV pilin-like G/H family protein [Anabaena sp. FACHB-1237]MBD2137722.1 type IV pilin-like G/H family protein [Anabaena sp. FACHB-1237]